MSINTKYTIQGSSYYLFPLITFLFLYILHFIKQTILPTFTSSALTLHFVLVLIFYLVIGICFAAAAQGTQNLSQRRSFKPVTTVYTVFLLLLNILPFFFDIAIIVSVENFMVFARLLLGFYGYYLFRSYFK